jgi:transposase-like protein
MPSAYPREFREDVIRVARNREPGVRIKDIAADFRISESCVDNWLRTADADDGIRLGTTTDERSENRELKKASAATRARERGPTPRCCISVPGEPAGKMMFPLVRELADDGIPVTVTCRVLKLCRQQYYRWRDRPFTDDELDEAWLANAIFDAHRDDPEFGYQFPADEVRAAGHDVSDRVVWRICRDNQWWSVFGKPKRGKKSPPGAPAHDDLVRRQFSTDAPNVLWLADITEHWTLERQAVLLCDQRPVLEPDRRMGDRLENEGPARGRRDRDGRRPPRRRRGRLHPALGPRVARRTQPVVATPPDDGGGWWFDGSSWPTGRFVPRCDRRGGRSRRDMWSGSSGV